MNIVEKYLLFNILLFVTVNFVFTVVCACDCFNDTTHFSIIYDALVNCICDGSSTTLNNFHEKVQILTLEHSDIEVLDSSTLNNFKESLIDLHITAFHKLNRIENNTFNEFSDLRSLYITKIPTLRNLSLEIFEYRYNKLRFLGITKTGLKYVPKIYLENQFLDIIDFEGNLIEIIETNRLTVQANLIIFNYNKITKIEAWAFNNSQISNISFKGNHRLQTISDEAFSGLKSLTYLDLSETSIQNIPTSGLNELEVLIIRNTYTLKMIPSIYDFNNLQKAQLTHFFHCCAFYLPERHDAKKFALHKAYMENLTKLCSLHDSVNQPRNNSEITIITDDENFSEDVEWQSNIAATNDGKLSKFTKNNDFFSQSSFELQNNTLVLCGILRYRKHSVQCTPVPNAFNPCEDIMGYEWLRISVWFVALTGLFGNVCALAVILSKPTEMTLQNFLICNLAFSDLCMAIFLLLLAIEDLISEGYYFNFAYNWQQGIGCRIVGFITIFSTQLSIFILCLLTIERWFTIKKALHLNKLNFHKTIFITFCGWLYALTMATLPLIGISSYSMTSLCLPMDTGRGIDKIYVLFLLLFASISFLIICVCYFQIYFSLSYETRHKDGEYVLARKMTILVATNFACYAPITFFALTAVLGFPLINITNSKILLVFFYPLNSCANPFLYAILTSTFKRDFIYLLSKFGICKKAAQNYTLIYYQPKGNIENQILRPSTSHTVL